MKWKRGFTLIELLTVMAIIALLVGLLLPALASARAKAQMTKDQTQIKQIHTAWSTFARDYNGVFPTPGVINPMDVTIGGFSGHVPGRGAEDLDINNTPFMFAACIMANYFTPQILIAPTEPSGYVTNKDDFIWSVYDPQAGIYWDSDKQGGDVSGLGYTPFAVDLNGDDEGVCNTSYGHPPIVGQRKVRDWKDSLNSKWPIIGNRGPAGDDGTAPSTPCADCPDYEDSITIEFHGGDKQWFGNIGFNDNHVEYVGTLWPEGLNYRDPNTNEPAPDHLFQNNAEGDCTTGDGNDAWLTLTRTVTDTAIDIECD